MVTFFCLATEVKNAPRDEENVRQAAKKISSKWDPTVKNLRSEEARRRTEQLYDLMFHSELQTATQEPFIPQGVPAIMACQPISE